jgi:hypothetical protein
MAPGEIDGPYSYVALGDSISIDEYAGGPGRGGACGVPEVGLGSMTSGDRWSDTIPAYPAAV